MAQRHLKKWSAYLVIREMQIKTTLRFYLKPVKIVKMKNRGQQMLERLWGKRNTSPLLVGLQAGKTTLKIS